MDNQKKIGEKIKIARVSAGMTQENFGKKIGFSAMGVSYLENGQRELKIKDIEKIAEVLSLDVNELLQPITMVPDLIYHRSNNSASDEQQKDENKSISDFDRFILNSDKEKKDDTI